LANESATSIDNLIDRLRAGDEAARWDLLERAHGRLRGLAAQILGDFPRVREDGLWQTTEVASEARLRLAEALREVGLNDKQHFFRLAAQKIRFLLIDIVRRMPRPEFGGPGEARPGRPAWLGREYHDVLTHLFGDLEGLPEDQYAVIDLEFVFGFSGREIADALGVDETTVRRRRRHAYDALATRLRAAFPGLDTPPSPEGR
jgi:DNA-directed RNA polymerase specialized sigma24 family protein